MNYKQALYEINMFSRQFELLDKRNLPMVVNEISLCVYTIEDEIAKLEKALKIYQKHTETRDCGEYHKKLVMNYFEPTTELTEEEYNLLLELEEEYE